MKKRLRKKKRLGEFRDLGFRIDFRFDPKLWDWESVFDRFLAEVHQLGLRCSGGLNTEGGGVLVLAGRLDLVTEAQRSSLAAWCEHETTVSAYRVGPLVDEAMDHQPAGEWEVKVHFPCA